MVRINDTWAGKRANVEGFETANRCTQDCHKQSRSNHDDPKSARLPLSAHFELGHQKTSFDYFAVALTLRLSCGARAPQRVRPRPPARRLLQPVVRHR